MTFLLIRWFSSRQEKQRQEGARTLQLEEARKFFFLPEQIKLYFTPQFDTTKA